MDEKDEETSVAKCRAWYDANNYDKSFCCQMESIGGEWDANVVDATSTVMAAAFTKEMTVLGLTTSVKYKFSALTFKGAQALASGMAVLASAAVYMH